MITCGEPVFGQVADFNPIVKTMNGLVRGQTSEGVAVFRGIPYGSPVDGLHRWLPAQTAASWSGVRDCTRNGPIAIQILKDDSNKDSFGERYFSGDRYHAIFPEPRVQHENCLMLNVLTPNLDGAKLPVLVYFHGGGFSSGSGNLILGADGLAREENLVLVSVNHRLNVFGYLDLSCLDEKYAGSGNVGQLDLVLALEWVRDNISVFGGNPEQVTIMGESGGAMKVSTLLAMEKSLGLFHRAIVESGSTPVGTTTPAEAAEKTHALLRTLGVTSITELLNVPARDLFNAAERALQSLNRSGFDLGFGPVGDDRVVPANLGKQFIAPELSRQIPLLVGASEDELGIFGMMPEISWDQFRAALLHPADHLKPLVLLTHVHDGSPICSEAHVDAVIAAAQAGNHKGETPGHTLMKIVSSKHFLTSGAYFQAMAKARQGGAPVYYYFITYDAPNLRGFGEGCSWHTADLPLQMRLVFCPETEPMSRRLAQSWGAFIRGSNPSTPKLNWPRFTVERQETMVMDDDWSVQSDPGKTLRVAWGDELFH